MKRNDIKYSERCIIDCLVRHWPNCNIRRNYVLPNASWGLGFNYEIDLLSVTKQGYATEYEIKTNIQDLKRDLKKRHGHSAICRNGKSRIRQLFFVFPKRMIECGEQYVPERAGIILISKHPCCNNFNLSLHRKAKILEAVPFTKEQLFKILHLNAMRYWKDYHNYTDWLKQTTHQMELFV